MGFTKKRVISMAVVTALSAPFAAWATNGMNLEAYGPIAGGMGGAAFAYDNGTAAVMNNPATLGMMEEGSRLDVAVGSLGPDISSSTAGMPDADSSATAFYMPAVGWVKKRGALAYGVGVFAQGGMGTEYDANSFLTAGSNETVRSEVGLGRFLIPLSYSVNERLNIAGSLDYVWASMDLKMAMSGAQFGDMLAPVYGGTQEYGTASGSMVDSMMGMVGTALDPTGPVNWARFDFSNNSAFLGEAYGNGFAGKLGITYKIGSRWSVGATYHSKTRLGDMTTGNAKVSMSVNMDLGLAGGGASTGYTAVGIPVSGKISVKNFQWPETYGIGAAFQATDKIMIAADVKRIGWASVMKNFEMRFVADATQANPLAAGFAGQTLDAVMFQDWEDQTVFALGASFQTTEELVLRIGYNGSTNPVPDKYLNPLFPATIENNYTFGGGYEINNSSSVNASFTYSPEVSATSAQGVTVSHSQFNWQVMYSHLF
ncbi:MAG: outer membrane protein transport protein [Gammaproteobacteria bacterium]|nr:outer membrane protein transport protein [Gammaproteobacteria bacterium]MCF6364325.1 outer membrane protein transport protein [Gammaproteobacteria bacterium]